MTDTEDTAAAELPTYEAFAAAEGDMFTIGQNSRRARLASVSECRRQSGWESFALVFELPAEPALAQAMYHLDHAELGVIALLLVPLGPAPNRPGQHRYEAAFNRRAMP